MAKTTPKFNVKDRVRLRFHDSNRVRDEFGLVRGRSWSAHFQAWTYQVENEKPNPNQDAGHGWAAFEDDLTSAPV